MKALTKMAVLALCSALTACSMGSMGHFGGDSSASAVKTDETPLGAGTAPGVAIGGSIGQSMDAFDRVKLSRALDKSPGKPTSWVNQGTGVDYTVTPLRKVTVNGNPFCRQYQTVATKGESKQQMTGTACVAADGAWSEVNG